MCSNLSRSFGKWPYDIRTSAARWSASASSFWLARRNLDLAALVIDPCHAFLAQEFQPANVLVFAAHLTAQPDVLGAQLIDGVFELGGVGSRTPSKRQVGHTPSLARRDFFALRRDVLCGFW